MSESCRPKKIIHVIDSLAVGGAQTHLVTMLRGMKEADLQYEHRVLSLFGDGTIRQEFETLDIPVDVLDIGDVIRARRFDRVYCLLVDYFRSHDPHLVEAHLSYARIFALPAARIAGVNARLAFEHGDLYLNSPKFRFAHWSAQFAANKVVVVSEALRSWASSTYGLTFGRSLIIHNCVDTQRLRSQQTTNQFKPDDLSWPSAGFVYAMVGMLGAGVNKRVDVAIRAIASARKNGLDAGLVVVGDGSLRPELEQLADELDAADSIVFLGIRKDVPQVLSQCDAFCHSAPFEPFGIVCIEAMAMGLPVIVPNSGGLPEIVTDGATGLLYEPLNVDALAEKMVQLARQPQLQQKLAAAGAEEVNNRFTVERYCEQIENLYADVLKGRSHN